MFAENSAVSKGLKAFTLQLVEQITDKIGWEATPKEDFLIGQLRSLLLTTAGGVGHQKCVITIS